MTSFPFFFKTAAATAKYQFRRFRFRICWCHGLQKVKVYQQTKLRRYISIGGWDIITSVFEIQMSAILEFYFRFWSRPLSVICMSFCITLPNFSQIGAPTAKIWRHFIFQDGRHVSIDGWDITTSVFETQTSAILKIYFRFRFRPFAQNLDIILHQATKFGPNRNTHCENMTSYPFATAKYYFRFHICWCHCHQKVKSISKPNFVEISQMAAEI